MADDVPVTDILCEAMEYLSKLGTNLRARSENLKETKIRKDRLKNCHAVIKAAQKVLTICELSKKSLDNVETGVKRMLSVVDAAQANTGDAGKSINHNKVDKTRSTPSSPNKDVSEKRKKHKEPSKIILIPWKNQVLRMNTKVNMKHYQSLKVFARPMSKSMMEKYPVFYNCKLYRARVRKACREKNENSENEHFVHHESSANLKNESTIENQKEQLDGKDLENDNKNTEKNVKEQLLSPQHIGREEIKTLAENEPSTHRRKESSDESSDADTLKSSKKSHELNDSDAKKMKENLKDPEQFDCIDLENDNKDEEKNVKEQLLSQQHIGREEIKTLAENEPSTHRRKESSDESSDADILNSSKKSHELNNSDAKRKKELQKDPEQFHCIDLESDNNDEEKNVKKEQHIGREEIKTLAENKPSAHKRKESSNESSDVDILKSSKKSHKLKHSDAKRTHSKSSKNTEHADEVTRKHKKSKHVRIISSDSEDEETKDTREEETSGAINIINLQIENEDSESEKLTIKKSLTEKLGTTTRENLIEGKSSNDNSNDKTEEKNCTETESETKNKAEENIPEESVTPLIKCVSISKLLKPDILQKESIDLKPKMIVHMNRKGELKTKPFDINSLDVQTKNSNSAAHIVEDSYEKTRRKLVQNFKPKKFSINIIKLPPLTENFLCEFSLKKITQNSSIICEIKTASSESKSNSDENTAQLETELGTSVNDTSNDFMNVQEKISDTSQNKSSSENISETERIKNALLLNDSESEKSEAEHTSRQNSVDKTFENCSRSLYSDKNSSENDPAKNHVADNERNSNKDLADNRCKTSEKEMLPGEDQDKELAKSSLLNDSSDSSTKSPVKKKSSSVLKSRRKHIMESMHAKKMLLTYSSSSDTEDEQLKNVIKNIKDNLMKDNEDDEKAIKTVQKKLRSSSDSDEEDVLKHSKKKRKISRSKSPSPKADAEEVHKDKTKSENEDSSSNVDRADKKSSSSEKKMGRSREKPGGSSDHSDTQDEKEVEGLTNLKSLTNHRRRRDSGSDKAESTSTRSSARSNKKEKMTTKHISGQEGLLEVSESSGEESALESDGPEEDLPPITLPSGLNGGSALEHLAKDDLLDESEAESLKEDNNTDVKKETDSDSDALKSKRRKGNTISSDSEAGSSRRKQRDDDVKVSDFEDSEDDNLEPIRRKRKKKGSESDASAGSSSDGGKKKRKRIKQLDSDGSGSDSETEGKNKHGRKNIRKVMGKNQLEEATKKAAREEKERVARIAERQKMYNNLEFDESGRPDEVIVDKVVLDFDPETKEPLIEVDRGLVKKLKPHQANGIKFMWDACFESVKRIKKDKGSGCILAHCMGLGKTLQVVSLTHTLLIHSELTKVNRVLVVCPLSTVLNWVNEFRIWLKHAETDYEVDVYELSKYKQNSERAFQLSSWYNHGGVCVLGYEMFRNLSADNVKKFKKKMLRQFQESLVDPGPDLVVCDEGHLLKNEKTSLSQSMNRVKTLRRIVLTGTPLQNNLKEYYCMVQFVKPNLLGKYNEYLNRFVNPITNGQYTDSTEHDIKIMKRRSHVLHKMLDGAVQRRDYGVLAPFLPPKHEYVLFITLTEVQIKLYQHYLDNYSRRPLAGKSSGFLFPDFQSLQRIWTHPLVLKYNSERYEIMQQKKREREEEEDSEGSLADFIDDDSSPEETSTEEESDSLSDVSDDSRKKSKKKKSSKKGKTKEGKLSTRRATRANPVEQLEDVDPDPDILEVKNENPTEWWIPLVTDDEIEDMRNSHKLVLLFEILRQCEAIGDKLLVFSQSLYSLDLIEHFLGKVDEATQEGRIDEKLGGHVGSWSPGIDYFRLDGSTSCENRSIWCKNFNREDNPRARLFLISTRAGGLGINLVAANRVVIFDVSWNPSHDVQSIFRVYRFGQKKPCYIYRFLAMGTMEEKIYERQVTKQAISKRVIDEQQIDRHYAENDLAELYKFEPRPPEPRPVPLLPKDRLFAEMLKEREHVIYKFHEHDSLLENKEEETLSEEERKAAWEDFENEKNRPPPQPFPNWPVHNGMAGLPNLLAQQQQQLAYAALASMLRKDMPGLTDDNIRAMLPLIYSSNPGMFGGYDYGLMQKLSSMYAQPGMMNPAMMNPGMNVGGAQAGMGGGGTSGLQYEPPWQRQQQQQQQMRLQQLMQQQQNQMGAKFYAGGLGSRDPVAMALQQQRAREIMLGGGGGGGGVTGGAAVGVGAGAGAGRPRGRPPLQPRAPQPPAAPQDVVNLDSD